MYDRSFDLFDELLKGWGECQTVWASVGFRQRSYLYLRVQVRSPRTPWHRYTEIQSVRQTDIHRHRCTHTERQTDRHIDKQRDEVSNEGDEVQLERFLLL